METLTLPVQTERMSDRATEPVRVEDFGLAEGRLRVEDFVRVEDYLRAYLDDERFKSAYLRAYERWSDAATMLYSADSKDNVLAAGHKAREAIQEFASALDGSHDPRAWSPDSTEAKADRLSTLIETYRPQLGDSRCEFLESLFDYWRVLNDVVQRHEHGTQEVNEPLRWEDGRRVVVLTALMMVEVDRSLDVDRSL